MAHLPHIDYRHWLRSDNRQGWHGGHTPKRIILHDTESHDTAGIGDITGVCNYWDRQEKGYGAHFIVDADGNVGMYVPPTTVTWHCERNNTGSLGIEIIGFAKWPKVMWVKRKKQLDAVARILAVYHQRNGIPLKRGLDGVLTHKMSSDALGGSHWDPGPGFPFWYVLFKARQIAKREP